MRPAGPGGRNRVKNFGTRVPIVGHCIEHSLAGAFKAHHLEHWSLLKNEDGFISTKSVATITRRRQRLLGDISRHCQDCVT